MAKATKAPATKAKAKDAASAKSKTAATESKGAAGGADDLPPPSSPLAVGAEAPAFELSGDDGQVHTLAALRGKHVVIYFYPRDATPGCTLEAQAFRDALPAFEARGATVLGVSADSVASHARFCAAQRLNFRLLSDPSRRMIAAYGAWGEKVLYGKRSLGIVRSTILVGPDGIVRRVWPKVRVDGHASEVLAAIG